MGSRKEIRLQVGQKYNFVNILCAFLSDIPELLVLHTMPSKSKVPTILFTQCVWSWSQGSQTIFTIIKLIFLYTMPLLFMSVAYWQIVCVLWRSHIPGHNCKEDLYFHCFILIYFLLVVNDVMHFFILIIINYSF